MPWTWKLTRYCMDLSNGNVLNWPYPEKGLHDNDFYLERMVLTWRTWRFCHNTANPLYDWQPQDIDFDTWLNKDREQSNTAPSEYEKWAAQQTNEQPNGTPTN